MAYIEMIFRSMSEISFCRFLNDLGIERGFPILRDFEPHRAIARIDGLFLVAVAVIVRIRTFDFS